MCSLPNNFICMYKFSTLHYQHTIIIIYKVLVYCVYCLYLVFFNLTFILLWDTSTCSVFFLFYLFIKYWNIIEYYNYITMVLISVCNKVIQLYIHTYIYIYIYIYFPMQVITEYWVEFPVLYSKSLLIIYFMYSSVYTLIHKT